MAQAARRKLFRDRSGLVHPQLASYFNHPTFSDLVIVGPDGRRLKAHQVVLSSGSKRFSKILESGVLQQEEELPVWGVDSDALEAVIRCFYTGECLVEPSSVVAIMDTAQRLEVAGLAVFCEQYVQEVLEPGTVCTMLREALRFKMDELVVQLLQYVKSNFAAVVESEDFLTAPFEAVSKVLTAVNGIESDQAMLKAGWSWLLAEAPHSDSLDELVLLIKLPESMKPVDLFKNSFAQQHGIVRRYDSALTAAPAPTAGPAPTATIPSGPLLTPSPTPAAAAGAPTSSNPGPADAPQSTVLPLSQDAAAAAVLAAGTAPVKLEMSAGMAPITLTPQVQPVNSGGGGPMLGQAPGGVMPGLQMLQQLGMPVMLQPMGGGMDTTAGGLSQMPLMQMPGGGMAQFGPMNTAGLPPELLAQLGLGPGALGRGLGMGMGMGMSMGDLQHLGGPSMDGMGMGPHDGSPAGGDGDTDDPMPPPTLAPTRRERTSTASGRHRHSSSGRSSIPRGICQVEGCGEDLSLLRDYHQRYKICEYHLKQSEVMKDGLPQRFCQQCGRFQALTEFEGAKRSCRARLQRHNDRRRKRLEEEPAQQYHVMPKRIREMPADMMAGLDMGSQQGLDFSAAMMAGANGMGLMELGHGLGLQGSQLATAIEQQGGIGQSMALHMLADLAEAGNAEGEGTPKGSQLHRGLGTSHGTPSATLAAEQAAA